MMNPVSMKQFLEAGVHFGHHKRRWNPKMKRYIFTERNGIYILDLKKSSKMLRDAYKFVRDLVADGEKILFVGTKKQAKDPVADAARSCGMYWVTNRWLGGMLTNYRTVRRSVNRLITLEKMFEDGTIEKYSKKEAAMLTRELNSLRKNLEGVKKMDKLPGALFIIDPSKESIAIKEANRQKIPIVAICDTNCDPDPIDWIIPANDDAIRAIKLMCAKMAEACIEGVQARIDAGLMTQEDSDMPPEAFVDESALVDTEEKYGDYRSEDERLEEEVDYGVGAEEAPEDVIASAEKRASEAEKQARAAEDEAKRLLEQVQNLGNIGVNIASLGEALSAGPSEPAGGETASESPGEPAATESSDESPATEASNDSPA